MYKCYYLVQPLLFLKAKLSTEIFVAIVEHFVNFFDQTLNMSDHHKCIL
jgi:hypothetical protein